MPVGESGQREVPQASRRDYLIELSFMVLAMGPVLVSAYASLITGDGQWFQRSGALMVLFSVAVEYHRRRMPQPVVSARTGASSRATPTARIFGRFWRSIPYVCYFSVFMGTLIWSYGDLLF